jgi:hypothetical protein
LLGSGAFLLVFKAMFWGGIFDPWAGEIGRVRVITDPTVAILTICLVIYGAASFNREWRSDFITYATANPDVPNELKTTGGWNQFAISFLVGGIGGAFFAYQVYDHFDVLKALFSGRI